jgi:hypothetical protein
MLRGQRQSGSERACNGGERRPVTREEIGAVSTPGSRRVDSVAAALHARDALLSLGTSASTVPGARESCADFRVGVWGFNQNRSSLGPFLGLVVVHQGTPRIENGGSVAVDFADGGGTGTTLTSGPQSRQIQEKAQDYSGFGLKSQTPTCGFDIGGDIGGCHP